MRNFAKIVKNITQMHKKGNDIKWDEESKFFFERIKTSIMEVPVLINRDYKKDFIIFPFLSKHTIVVVLLQKNQQGYEQHVAFFSKALHHAELK